MYTECLQMFRISMIFLNFIFLIPSQKTFFASTAKFHFSDLPSCRSQCITHVGETIKLASGKKLETRADSFLHY